MTKPTAAEIRDTVMAKVEALIRDHGRAVMSIGSDENNPAFSYTIGNAPKVPELLVIDLIGQDATWLLNQVSERLAAGAPLGPLDLGGLVGVHVLPAEDAAARDLTRCASVWHDGINYPIAQVVLPDRHGRFPWNDDCAAPYKNVRLYGPPPARH